MLPHCHDNSNICRRHKLEQLPSCLPSSKWKNYTFSHFLTFKWCVKLGVSADCNATGCNCSALLLAVNPAVVWNQCQGDLQRGCVAIATRVGRRVSNSASTATDAQVSERSSLRPTLHTRTLVFTINKDLDRFWCMATQTVVHEICSLCSATKLPLFLKISWRDRTGYCCEAQQRFIQYGSVKNWGGNNCMGVLYQKQGKFRGCTVSPNILFYFYSCCCCDWRTSYCDQLSPQALPLCCPLGHAYL